MASSQSTENVSVKSRHKQDITQLPTPYDSTFLFTQTHKHTHTLCTHHVQVEQQSGRAPPGADVDVYDSFLCDDVILYRMMINDT